MITYGFQYDVKNDKREDFLKVANAALNAMLTMDGHIETKLFEDVNKPNSFMIYSEWATNNDFKTFMNSEAFKAVQNAARDMLKARPKHKMYETKDMH